MNIRRRPDHEIDRAPARLPTAIHDRGGEAPPFTRDRRSNRQWIESGFDRSETLCAARTLVRVICDLNAKVQLGQRSDADRGLNANRSSIADQDGRVENDLHDSRKRIDDPGRKAIQIFGKRLGRGRLPHGI